MGFPFFQLLTYCCLLFLEVFKDPLLPDLSLYSAHLSRKLLLGLEDVAKGAFVPDLELLLEIFKFLLEAVHLGVVRYLHLLPPRMNLLLKF